MTALKISERTVDMKYYWVVSATDLPPDWVDHVTSQPEHQQPGQLAVYGEMTSGPEGQSTWGAYPHGESRLPHNIAKLQVQTLYLHNIDLSNGVELGTHYRIGTENFVFVPLFLCQNFSCQTLPNVEFENCTISAHVIFNLCANFRLRALHLRRCASLPTCLPATIGRLAKLERLEINGLNSLKGFLPKELGNLTKLRLLYLQGTPHITGQIPTELGQLTNLHTLNLSGNALWGDIPTELGKLKKLKYLNLLGNALTGGIPKELGDTIVCKEACPRVWRRSQTSLSGTYRTTSTYGSLRLPKPTWPAACCGRPPPFSPMSRSAISEIRARSSETVINSLSPPSSLPVVAANPDLAGGQT